MDSGFKARTQHLKWLSDGVSAPSMRAGLYSTRGTSLWWFGHIYHTTKPKGCAGTVKISNQLTSNESMIILDAFDLKR